MAFLEIQKQRIDGEKIWFIQDEPNYWIGYITEKKPLSLESKYYLYSEEKFFEAKKDHLTYKYVVKFFNSNQLALPPIDSIEDVITIIDQRIKMGIKY